MLLINNYKTEIKLLKHQNDELKNEIIEKNKKIKELYLNIEDKNSIIIIGGIFSFFVYVYLHI